MDKLVTTSRRKSTIWNLVFSYSTIAYVIITGIFFVPIYINQIPLELYGAWLATGNVVNWLFVVDLGLFNVVQQRVAKSFGAGDFFSCGAYSVAGIIISGVIAFFITLIGLGIIPFVTKMVNLSVNTDQQILVSCYCISLAASVLMFLSFSAGNVNIGMQCAFKHGVVTLISNLSTILVTGVLLMLGFGLFAIAWGFFARAIVMFIGGFLCMLSTARRIGIGLKMNGKYIKEVCSLLSFTALGRVGATLASNVDAFLISRFLGPAAVPIYVLTRRGFSIAELLLNRTGNAIGPSLAHLSGEGGDFKMRDILFRLFSLNIWVLGLAFGGFLAFNDDFVRLWVGAGLFAGHDVSTIFCLLLVASVSGTILQTICVALGDIKRNAIAQFAQSLVIVSCMLGGIHFFGLIGAAAGHLIGFLVVSSWYYPRSLARMTSITSSDFRKLTWEAVLSLTLGLTLGWSFHPVRPENWGSFIMTALALAISYSIVLILIRPPLRKELQNCFNWVLSRYKTGLFFNA